MGNINNLFAGVFTFLMGMAFVYLIWSNMKDYISAIITKIPELGIFLEICWIVLVVVTILIVPISVSKTEGEE